TAQPLVIAARAEEATPTEAGVTAGASASLESAAKWLLEQQEDSGGFLGFSGEVDASSTAAAVVALYAAGDGDAAVAGSIEKAMTYLDQSGGDYAAAGPG